MSSENVYSGFTATAMFDDDLAELLASSIHPSWGQRQRELRLECADVAGCPAETIGQVPYLNSARYSSIECTCYHTGNWGSKVRNVFANQNGFAFIAVFLARF